MTNTDLCNMLASAGWTRRALALALNVTERQVCRWISGQSPITGPTEIAIKTVLTQK